MKFFHYSLRALIVAGSISGFFAGWALLAHAGKPVAANPQSVSVDAPAPLPTLPPLDFSTNGVPSGLQPLPSLPPLPQNVLPRMRTRGS